jgi:hypothetical protein
MLKKSFPMHATVALQLPVAFDGFSRMDGATLPYRSVFVFFFVITRRCITQPHASARPARPSIFVSISRRAQHEAAGCAHIADVQ